MPAPKQQTEIPNTPIKFLFFVSKPFKKWIYLALGSVFVASTLSASLAYVFRKIIDTATAEGGAINYSVVLFWVILYPVVVLLGSLAWRASGLTGARWVIGLETYGYKKLFNYLSKHSQSFFDSRFAGSLVGSIGIATSSVQSMVEMFLWNYLSTFITVIVSFALIATTNIWVAFLFLIWVVILITLNYFLAKKAQDFSKLEAKSQTKLRGRAVDTASNISIVHQFSQRIGEVGRLVKSINLYKDASLKAWNYSEKMMAINNILISLFVGSTLIATFYLWRQGSISLGEFVMVITLIADFLGSLTFIGRAMSRFARNFGQARQGLEDILHPHEIVDRENAKELIVKEGKVSLKKVSFNYEKSDSVINGLDFEIPAGQKVGIVGSSGAGKTTLIRILLRIHEIQKGKVLIDGQDINEVTLDSLRKSIAIVPQEPLLFHRSIKENILYGNKKATLDEVKKAAKLARADVFIDKLPKGYRTLVGERGVKLSAGQRQRVAIARAILKDAPILILDEATSALDSESEVAIQKALEELMKGKTVFAVAHRLSTLSEMDRIIVLENGKIAEDGSHNDLIKKKNGIYAKLWKHQAGGFLLE